MSTVFAFGLGIATINNQGEWLDTYYPEPVANPEADDASALLKAATVAGLNPTNGGNAQTLESDQCLKLADALNNNGLSAQAALARRLADTDKTPVITILTEDSEPKTVPEAYLKLHLLSHRLVLPHSVNLNGIFASLPNLAWTNEGPVALNEIADRQLQARLRGQWLSVKSVDKFPPMTDYVVPSGVRIADTARVRLGAYIGAGTTIMHEGFVNFNAGTEGTSMVEGRISAGVFIGEGSDLGGGSSTMGTLSGGGNVIISVGKHCLIGANAGIGIALGDRCTVEAGLYVTAGTKVAVLDENNQQVQTIKARELNGKSDLLFRRNSQTGAVECKTNKSVVELNTMLHTNN